MTVQCQATVTAEVLTRLARPVFRGGIDLDAVTGRVFELVVPDGAVDMPLVLSAEGAVSAVVVQTDAPLLLWLGEVGANTPLALQAYGSVALLGSDLEAAQGVFVTYVPGTGVPAHLVVYVAGSLTLVPPAPPDPWQWVLRYQEPFDYTVTWTQVGSYVDHFETASWGSFDPTKAWNLSEAAPVGNPLTNVALLDTTTPIVGAGSARLQMGHIVFGASTRNDGINLFANGSYPPLSGVIGSSNYSSGRWRTLLRVETPPDTPGVTGDHRLGVPWYTGRRAAQSGGEEMAFGFYLMIPVNTGTITRWEYGVWQGNWQYGSTFGVLQGGTFATPIPVGTVCALDVDCQHERQNAHIVRNLVRFGTGTDPATSPLLVDDLWVQGDVESVPHPYTTFTSAQLYRWHSFPTPISPGTCVYTLDETEFVWRSDTSASDVWTSHWNSVRIPAIGLTAQIDPLTPLVGSGTLRIRRHHGYDFYLGAQPSLLPVGRNTASFIRFNPSAGGYQPLRRGRIRLLLRPNLNAGTRTSSVGAYCLLSGNFLSDNDGRAFGLLAVLNQATGLWDGLRLVGWSVGSGQAPTVLAEVARAGNPVGQVLALQLTWFLDLAANTLELYGDVGTQTNYSDLTRVLTHTRAAAYVHGQPIGTFTRGEGPCVIFDFDGASGDCDVDIDEIVLEQQVEA